MTAEPAAPDSTAETQAERFARLFEAYQPSFGRLVSAYVDNPADRDDLVQDIAVGIWKSLPGFRGDASERTWIYRVAHNIAVRNAYKVRKRTVREPSLAVSFDGPSSIAGAEEAMLAREKRLALVAGIRELRLLDRQIVTLHLEGLTAMEIQEVSGLSQGAVATRLTRIRQHLAGRIQAQLQTDGAA